MFIIGSCFLGYSLTYILLSLNSGLDISLEIMIAFIGIVFVILGMLVKKSKFSRTKFEVKVENSKKTSEFIVSYLNNNGYYLVNEKDEDVYKKGVGFWTAMKYIKVEVVDAENINLYGFIRPAFGNEQDLSGFVACIPKKQVSDVICKLKEEISHM